MIFLAVIFLHLAPRDDKLLHCGDFRGTGSSPRCRRAKGYRRRTAGALARPALPFLDLRIQSRGRQWGPPCLAEARGGASHLSWRRVGDAASRRAWTKTAEFGRNTGARPGRGRGSSMPASSRTGISTKEMRPLEKRAPLVPVENSEFDGFSPSEASDGLGDGKGRRKGDGSFMSPEGMSQNRSVMRDIKEPSPFRRPLSVLSFDNLQTWRFRDE